MGRKDKPVDPRAPFASFADGLRALRTASAKTYAQIGSETHYSTSVLSTAAAGRKLPTWDVTRAYVHACGGNEAEWAARWNAEQQAFLLRRRQR